MHPSTRHRYVDAAEDARPLFGLFEIALRFVGVTAEVFLRRGFGERYLTAGLLMGAGLLLLPLAAWIGGVSMAELPQTSPGTLLYLGSYIGFAVGRRAVVVRRSRSGHAWHSWCDGTPWRTWSRIGVSKDAARSLAEPLLVLAISLAALYAGDGAFSGYLMVVSGSMFLKEQRTRTRRREAWLDAQDRQIEDEELAAITSGSASDGSARGFAMPGLRRVPTSSRREIAARLRPMRGSELPLPAAAALQAIPTQEVVSPASPISPVPPVAAPSPPPRTDAPVFLTVELVPLSPSVGARAAEEGHESVHAVRDQAVEESGRAVGEASIRESSVRESPVRESPVRESPVRESPVRESPVRESPVRESSVRESSVREASVREDSVDEGAVVHRPPVRSGRSADMDSAPSGAAEEAAWVDAFATFRLRTRRAREAASEFDASDLERN